MWLCDAVKPFYISVSILYIMRIKYEKYSESQFIHELNEDNEWMWDMISVNVMFPPRTGLTGIRICYHHNTSVPLPFSHRANNTPATN